MFGLIIIKKSTYYRLMRALVREKQKADQYIEAFAKLEADAADLRRQLNEEIKKNRLNPIK